jgi:lipopolysaccharide biosynthesis protein
MLGPRLISFYLPQYHPIPENDKWWGKGFTDWVNVAKAKPRFKGHYQPHLPADLGYYDLMNKDIREAQAKLASAYGISGFCYYHYWFNGKLLLEKPFNEVLDTGKPDFPFCLCWANENWTRTWDGMDKECLISQNYDEYDPVQHMEWLEKAFSDNRYIRIKNKPIFLIYNAGGITDMKSIIKKWRDFIKSKGYEGLYLCSVISVHNKLEEQELLNLGFDAVVDFIPNGRDIPRLKLWNVPKNYLYRLINKIIRIFKLEGKIKDLPVTYVYDYESIIKKKISKKKTEYKFFPCVIPNWDNTARRRIVYIMQNDNADLYRSWLEKSYEKIKHYPEEEQIIFVNAWNEWAEGCHLEPDLRNGKKFLNATKEAVLKLNNL